MAKDDSANQTPRRQKPSPRSGYALPAGAHPKNTGGKKGRSGPKTRPFKILCRELIDDPKVQAAIRTVLEDPANRHLAATLKLIAGYAEGEPEQHIYLKTDDARKRLSDLIVTATGRRRAGPD